MRLLLRVFFLGLGVAIVGVLAFQLDPQEILKQVSRLGWLLPLIFIPYPVLLIFDTLGWSYAFPPGFLNGRIRLADLYLVRLAGEAINNTTPTAYLGGEPVKAFLLQRFRISAGDGLASVVIAKTTLIASQILFILTGAVLLVLRNSDTGLLLWGLILALPLALLFILTLVLWQKKGLFGPPVRLAKHFGLRFTSLAEWEARLDKADTQIRLFYQDHRPEFFKSAACHLLGWLLGITEVSLILTLMGIDFTWTDAFIIESLGQFAKGLGCFTPIPSSIGIQEGGAVLIFKILHLDPTAGLTFMLLKRVRELLFTAVGLCLVSHLSLRPERELAALGMKPSNPGNP